MLKPLRTSPLLRAIGRAPRGVLVLLKITIRIFVIAFVVLATIMLVNAFNARRKPDLQAWHRSAPESQFRARDARGDFDFKDYLALEDKIFAEVAEYKFPESELGGRSRYSRYLKGGPIDPSTFDPDWNRSFVLEPEGEIVAGAVLVHGLTDSPYSMRSIAEELVEKGVYCVGLRMPGHGTVPAGLLRVKWEDWLAAYEVAMAHIVERVGDERPVYAFGYSTGGAVALLQALEADDRQRPEGIVLMSPAVGITAFARASAFYRIWSWIPYFEKSKWLDIAPEYDPYKYVSFPSNGGWQTFRVTKTLQKHLARAAKDDRIEDLPPILTFQSLVDATVVAKATKEQLYDRLPVGDGELVLFDINRISALDGFYFNDESALIASMEADTTLPYRLTFIANTSPDSTTLIERSKPPKSAAMIDVPIDEQWPRDVYSLAHVAIPFPDDDPFYGSKPRDGFQLGNLALRGERNVLKISATEMLRLRHNPLHDYMIERIEAFMETGQVGTEGSPE